jgi:hypothetical protein
VNKKLCTECGGAINKDNRKNSRCSLACDNKYESKFLDSLKNRIEATTSWRPLPLEPTINIITPYPVLVVGDVHCPIHDERWLHLAIITAKHFGVRDVVINGDLIDAGTISRHLGGEWRRKGELNDDVESAGSVVRLLCDEFSRVFYTLGNHSQRLIQKFMGEVAWSNLLKMVYDNPKFKGTERHFLDINSKVRCLHPRGYSRVRGKLTADMAQRYQMHLITGHHHHTASTVSADGKYQAVEIGCLARVDWFGYAQYAMHGLPEMMNGFGIVLPESEGNLILNFNAYTPFHRLGIKT